MLEIHGDKLLDIRASNCKKLLALRDTCPGKIMQYRYYIPTLKVLFERCARILKMSKKSYFCFEENNSH